MIILTLFIIIAVASMIGTFTLYKKDREKGKSSERISDGKQKPSIGKSILIGLLTAILYIAVLVVAALISLKTFDAFIYIVFAYFGWKMLNRIQPAMFIWMPLIGWAIYFAVKFILSALIGAFVAPVVIAKKIFYMVNRSLA